MDTGQEPDSVLIGPCGIETNEINQAILEKEVLIGPCGIETADKRVHICNDRSINWTLRN